METLPLPVGQLDSIKDVSTAVSNALNPFALELGAASGGANASGIVAAAAAQLGPQVCVVELV